MLMRWFILFFLLISAAYSCDSFESANEYYRQERYEDALSEYQKCLDTPVFSLLYNLGNTYFKLQKYGLARLYFEKARVLSPNNRNLRFNLELLSEKMIDEEDPRSQVNFHFSQVRALQILSILIVLGAVFFWRRSSIGVWVYRFFLIIILAFGFYVRHSLIIPRDRGVVISPMASLFSNRNLSSTVTAKVHEGKSLRILEEGQAWLLVEPEAGVRGWIPREDVGRI